MRVKMCKRNGHQSKGKCIDFFKGFDGLMVIMNEGDA